VKTLCLLSAVLLALVVANPSLALDIQAADLGKLRLCEEKVAPDYRGLPRPSDDADLSYELVGGQRLLFGKTTTSTSRGYEIAYWLIDLKQCEFAALVVAGSSRRVEPAPAKVFFLSSTRSAPKVRWRSRLLDKMKQRPRERTHPTISAHFAGPPPRPASNSARGTAASSRGTTTDEAPLSVATALARWTFGLPRQPEDRWTKARGAFDDDVHARAAPGSHFCPCFSRERIEPLTFVADAEVGDVVLELRREQGTDAKVPLGMFAVLTDKKKKRHAYLFRVDDATLKGVEQGLFVIEFRRGKDKPRTVLVDGARGKVFTVGGPGTRVKVLSPGTVEVFENGASLGEVKLR